MKKKLPSENRSNFFDTYPLELCFGELLAMACPVLLSLKTYHGHRMLENGTINRMVQVCESVESASVSSVDALRGQFVLGNRH